MSVIAVTEILMYEVNASQWPDLNLALSFVWSESVSVKIIYEGWHL